MHEIKRNIIDHLKFNPGSRFADFRIQPVSSHKLSYHLKELERGGLIENDILPK